MSTAPDILNDQATLEHDPADTGGHAPADLGQPSAAADPAPTQDDAPPERNARLVSQAQSLGLSDEDLAAFPDDESLATVLNAITTRALDLYEASNRQHQTPPPVGRGGGPQSPFGPAPYMPPQAPPGPWPASPPPPFQQPQQPQQGPPAIKPLELKIDEDAWGKDIADAFRAMNEYYQQQLTHVNSSLQQQQELFYNQMQQAQLAQADQYAAWFDGKLNELGEDYHAAFGVGPIDKLRQGSVEYQNRLKLDDALMRLSQAWPDKESDELFDWALTMVLGKSQSNPLKQVSAQLSARSAKTIGRPKRVSTATSDGNDIDPESGHPRALLDSIADQLRSYQEP